jgi:chemotaxis response regulator CheB
MEKTIRVLVANRPRLMRDLVLATITDQPDIEVLGEVENESDIRSAIERMQPDCLIIAMDEPDLRPALCDALLRDYPEMKILAVCSDYDSSMFFWASLDIHEHKIESSEQGVLAALRTGPAARGVTH